MPDDTSKAQTKVQMQIVEQLEQQLYKVGIQTKGLSTFMTSDSVLEKRQIQTFFINTIPKEKEKFGLA